MVIVVDAAATVLIAVAGLAVASSQSTNSSQPRLTQGGTRRITMRVGDGSYVLYYGYFHDTTEAMLCIITISTTRKTGKCFF